MVQNKLLQKVSTNIKEISRTILYLKCIFKMLVSENTDLLTEIDKYIEKLETAYR